MAIYDIVGNEVQAVPYQHSTQGPLEVIATGTFGSGSLKLQKQDPDGAWKDIPDAAWSDVVAKLIHISGPAPIRFDHSGSTPTFALRLELNSQG